MLAGKRAQSEHIEVLLSVFLLLQHLVRVYQLLQVFEQELIFFQTELLAPIEKLLHFLDVVLLYVVAAGFEA